MTENELRSILERIHTWKSLGSYTGLGQALINFTDYYEIKIITTITYANKTLNLKLILDKNTPKEGGNIFSVIGYIDDKEFHSIYKATYDDNNTTIQKIELVSTHFLNHSGEDVESTSGGGTTTPVEETNLVADAIIYYLQTNQNMHYDQTTGNSLLNNIKTRTSTVPASTPIAQQEGEYLIEVWYESEVLDTIKVTVPSDYASTDWTDLIEQTSESLSVDCLLYDQIYRKGTLTLNNLGNGTAYPFGTNNTITKFDLSSTSGSGVISAGDILELYLWIYNDSSEQSSSVIFKFKSLPTDNYYRYSLVKDGAINTGDDYIEILESSIVDGLKEIQIAPTYSSKRGGIIFLCGSEFANFKLDYEIRWLGRQLQAGCKSGTVPYLSVVKDTSGRITDFKPSLLFSQTPVTVKVHKTTTSGGTDPNPQTNMAKRYAMTDYTDKTKWSLQYTD